MKLSEEMGKDIENNGIIDNAWANGYCSGLNTYIPKVEALEKQNEKLKQAKNELRIFNVIIRQGFVVAN